MRNENGSLSLSMLVPSQSHGFDRKSSLKHTTCYFWYALFIFNWLNWNEVTIKDIIIVLLFYNEWKICGK